MMHMAYTVRHTDKKSGTVYIYECESYWDKEKKAPRNRQRCIGKEDPKTREIVPCRPKRATKDPWAGVTASCKMAGGTFLLEHLDRKLGVSRAVEKCFGQLSPKIMSVVYYLAQKGQPLSRCETWSGGHLHPYGDVITSQDMSELLDLIGPDEQLKFFSLWLAKICESEYLCYDITSVSSYASNIPYVKYGYNRDRESLPQINVAMLYGQKSMMPAYFRRMPGNISDVATLATTVRSLDFLGARKLHFVLDRGFYSKANVDRMFEARAKVTVSLPSGLKWVEKLVDGHVDRVKLPTDYLQLSENEILFAATELYSWGDERRRCYVHMFYNPVKAANDIEDMTRRLLALKAKVEAGERLGEREKELASRFLVVKDTPKRGRRVSFNEKELGDFQKKYAGFFCVLSNKFKDAKDAIECYRRRDMVENSFDDLKNALDMNRIRVHTARRMDARLFIQFLALIFMNEIRKTTMEDKVLRHLTVRETMDEMETLCRITYANRRGQLLTEMNKIQRRIVDVFGVKLPES
jgi:hypothetical protein